MICRVFGAVSAVVCGTCLRLRFTKKKGNQDWTGLGRPCCTAGGHKRGVALNSARRVRFRAPCFASTRRFFLPCCDLVYVVAAYQVLFFSTPPFVFAYVRPLSFVVLTVFFLSFFASLAQVRSGDGTCEARHRLQPTGCGGSGGGVPLQGGWTMSTEGVIFCESQLKYVVGKHVQFISRHSFFP